MQTTITVSGKHYHYRKYDFKTLLKIHDLKWSGNWSNNIYVWKNDNNKVDVDFIREDDRTKEVIIKIDGSEALIQDIQEWAEGGIIKPEDVKERKFQEIKIRWEEKIRQEKVKNAPKGWINEMIKQRDKEIKELEEK